MNRKVKKTDISVLGPIFVFGTYAVCVIAVLLFGANVYRTATTRDRISYDHRTVSQYLSTRVRQNDSDGAVFIGDFYDAVPVVSGGTLFLREEIGGTVYLTRIYCKNGFLCELFSEADENFEPGDGEPILEMNALEFKVNDRLLYIDIEYADGKQECLELYLRNTEGTAK